MHLYMKLTGIALAAGFGAMIMQGAPQAAQQPAGQQPAAQGQKKKAVKDQREYQLFNDALKATDPNKKLELLNTWKKEYPQSDFKDDRDTLLIQTNLQAGKVQDAIATAKDLLARDPKNITAMFFINTLTPVAYPANPPADALDLAEKAANGLLNAEMPAGTKPEEWEKGKKDLQATAHKTLGWVAWQRKNLDAAEQEFTKSLELNPNQAEVSYWFGQALRATKKPEKQAAALFEFARAVVLDPKNGGLPSDAVRKELEKYLTTAYTSYHGSTEGLDQLRQQAKASALPPAGLNIKTGAEIAAEKEEEFKRTNPQLALWMSVKKELSGPNGEQYFESSMKGAQLPQLKGTILEAKPAVRSKELILGIQDANTPEVTLKLDAPLTGKPKVGTQLEFQGVPTTFSREPFMVTMDTEKAKLTGLEMEAPTPVRKPVARKKSAKKKK